MGCCHSSSKFKPAYSVGDLLLHLDALEHEAADMGHVQTDQLAKI
jgi:hypothetical protein